MVQIDQTCNGRLVKIEKLNAAEKSWEWRKNYEDLTGIITVVRDTGKATSKYFVILSNGDKFIQTGYGELSINGSIVTIKTKNSKYTFLIQ